MKMNGQNNKNRSAKEQFTNSMREDCRASEY